MPGLGDDFYAFEQRFGLPQSFDAKHGDWTWARYLHKGSQVEVIAGARGHRGDVDVLVLKVPRPAADEASLIGGARAFAGRYRGQALSPPSKSVRYLPSGRLELTSRTAAGYRMLLAQSNPDNSFIVVLSRGNQDIEHLLGLQSQKCALLSCVRFLQPEK